MGRVFAIGTLIFVGAMLADVLAHPQGTTSAANGVKTVLTPSLQAVAGQKVS